MEMLIENGYMERQSTLKDTYMKYLNPMKLDYDNDRVWDAVVNNEVVDLFQFDSLVALDTVQKIKPRSLIELTQSNSLMRLSQQENAEESPTDTYVRFKNDIREAYKEMDEWGVPKKDQVILERVLKPYNFVADTQEVVMTLSRIPELTNFSVAEAHKLRKAIGKKSAKVMAETKELFYKKGMENNVSTNTLDYIWEVQIRRQEGYAFSILHCIAYTFIALQELVLYTKYPPIYWNCACLTVNAGSADTEDENEKNRSTNYGKIATAIGNMQQRGISIILPEANKADFNFRPDESINSIIFGLKGINGIGDEIANQIIENRPYTSTINFYEKNPDIGKINTITLIKGGCFDSIENKDRIEIMKNFLEYVAKIENPPKEKLTMQNLNKILELNIISEEYGNLVRLYKFTKHIFDNKFFHSKIRNKSCYWLDDRAKEYFHKNCLLWCNENQEYFYDDKGNTIVNKSLYNKGYEKQIAKFNELIASETFIKKFNNAVIEQSVNQNYEKYCEGSISKWEMDSLSFYYSGHELNNIDKDYYDFADFNELKENPTISNTFEMNGKICYKFYLHQIAGTVLDKNKNKHTISLLTTTGVVNVKFYQGNFAHYDKQVARINEDGSKTILEKSWFKRGNKLIITGFRSGNYFIPRKYKNSIYQHTVVKINDILPDGRLNLQSERIRVENVLDKE